MRSELFPYGKRAFVTNLVFILVMIIFSFILVLIGPVDLTWLAILLSLEILALLVLGVSPFLTDHELSDRKLTLRQGWYFRTTIELHDIMNLEVSKEGPSRTGVYYKVFESSIYVIAQKGQIIILRLRKPKRFGLVLGKKADRVVFDVADTNQFMKRMNEAGMPTLSNPILKSESQA